MHDAEVHIFSDSVYCMVKGAMNEPEIQFTKGWNDYLEIYKEFARIIDGEKIQFIFLGKKTNEIAREIDEWIRQGEGEDGQHFAAETCPHRFLLWT